MPWYFSHYYPHLTFCFESWFSKLLKTAVSFPISLYHTIMNFNNPKEDDFWKHCWKRRKCWKPAFSPFPTKFSTIHKTNLTLSQMTNFRLPHLNSLRMTNSNLMKMVEGSVIGWKKKFLLFSQFSRLVMQTCKIKDLFGKGCMFFQGHQQTLGIWTNLKCFDW